MGKIFEECFDGRPIVYSIHRDSVLARDPSKFIQTFDVARISSAGKLRDLQGSLLLSFAGWDHDPRAIHEIPEIRAFAQELDRQYPYLAYALSTKIDTLRMLSLCLVPNSLTQHSSAASKEFKATYDNRAYHEILQRWLSAFDSLCARARCFTLNEHAEMTIELANYFRVEWYLKN